MKKIFQVIVLIVFASSCASTNQYVKFQGESPVQKKAEKARIVLIRPGFIGAIQNFKIFQDGIEIGKLGPNSYLSWDVPIGDDIHLSNVIKYAYWFKTHTMEEQIVIHPKAGKTYYVKQNVLTNIELKIISEYQARKYIERIKTPNIKYIDG